MKTDFAKENFVGVDEEVFYCGKPSKKNYPVVEIVLLTVSMLLVIALDGFLSGSSFVKALLEKTGISTAFAFVVALVVHLVPLGAWLLSVNKKINFVNRSYILVTDKKAALFSAGKVFTAEGVAYEEVIDFFTEKGKLVFVTDDGKFVVDGVDDIESVAEKIRNAFKKNARA